MGRRPGHVVRACVLSSDRPPNTVRRTGLAVSGAAPCRPIAPPVRRKASPRVPSADGTEAHRTAPRPERRSPVPAAGNMQLRPTSLPSPFPPRAHVAIAVPTGFPGKSYRGCVVAGSFCRCRRRTVHTKLPAGRCGRRSAAALLKPSPSRRANSANDEGYAATAPCACPVGPIRRTGVPDDIRRPRQNPLHTAKRQSFASVPAIGIPSLPDERRLSHSSFSWFVFTGFVCQIIYIIF